MKVLNSKRNGNIGALEFGDLTPETRPIKIQRKNVVQNDKGEIVEILEDVYLQGYVSSDRCPSTVKVKLWAADADLRELAEDQSKSEGDRIYSNNTDYQIATQEAYYRHLQLQLLAVIRGLEEEEADVLASEPDRVHKILVYLGWETLVSDDNGEEAFEDSPEEIAKMEVESP